MAVSPEAPRLRVEAVRCRRGGRMILDGVDLEVRRGQACALLGPNGAGKTTLLRFIAGAQSGEAGEVWLDGAAVGGLPLHRRARLGIGYLAQHPSAFGGLSVGDNLLCALELAAVPKAQRGEERDRLLELFGLTARRSQRAATLSGGERRRLELARLWAQGPRVLLLDEPFAGLDPPAIRELSAQLARLVGEEGAGGPEPDGGVALLLAEHRVEQALTICQRACILVAGRVASHTSAAEVAAHPEAAEMIGLGAAGEAAGA